MHRSENRCPPPDGGVSLLEFPAEVNAEEVQSHRAGQGPLFHRRYSTEIRDSRLGAQELMQRVKADLNRPAPAVFARFEKVLGEQGGLEVGDEYVVRMPGPWDGPVRVIHVSPRAFRFATLDGHLEAGQIEFRVGDGHAGQISFEIESWARSASWLTHVLYHHLRMSKEVQAHMWISFLEGVVALSGGRMTGGVTIATERID